jgi:UDP-N-acetylmuramate dehydrogenase
MAYRTSLLKRGELHGVVLGASFRVRPTDRVSIEARMHETRRMRRATQPTGPSLGSMFANPAGDAAGRLIDAAGLKGARCGGAEVSRLHANFIVNRGEARASDVLELVQEVQHAVWRHSSRWLVLEVQLAGRWSDEDRLTLEYPPGKSTNIRFAGGAGRNTQLPGAAT